MIRGIDISNWNLDVLSQMNFAPLKDASMFTIMKASEGITYKDRHLDLFYNIIHGANDGKPSPDRMYGFYHFARPETGTTPMQEAHNFLRLVKHHAGHAIFALDVEAGALTLPHGKLDKWVKEWCECVHHDTGVKPMIYCSASQTERFKSAAEMSCGLWVAKWSQNKPTKKEIAPWSLWAIWQDGTTNGRLDTDYFNGDIEAWKKYCKGDRA